MLSTLFLGFSTNQVAAEDPNLSNLNAVKNARGDEILLLADEELVNDPVLAKPAQKKPLAASKNKLANNKRAANTKKPATGENAVISKLEFKNANMIDVARALGDMSGLNIVTTEAAAKKNVTVYLQNITVKNALDTISKNTGLWYRYDKTAKNYRIMTTDEYQNDLVIYRDDVTRVYDILHPNPW